MANPLKLVRQPDAGECVRSCHLFDRVGDAVLVAESPGLGVVLWNAAAGRLFGYTEAEAATLRLTDIFADRSMHLDALIHSAMHDDAGLSPAGAGPLELVATGKDSHELDVEATFAVLEGGGPNTRLILVIARDISQRKRSQQRLADHALHDALTGLPNRFLLADRFRQATLSARRDGGSFSLLMLDLNGFKRVNDELGHGAGDAVLRVVAERLRSAVRDADTVARVGGDEFVLLGAAASEADAGLMARRVIASLAEPIDITGRPVKITASVGLALFPRDGRTLTELSECADQAMYRAKRSGGGYSGSRCGAGSIRQSVDSSGLVARS